MVNVLVNGVQPRAPDRTVAEIRMAEIANEEARRRERSRVVLRVVLIVAIAVGTFLFAKYVLPKILEVAFEYVGPWMSPPADLPKSGPPAISPTGYAVYDPERVRELTAAQAANMSVANYGARVTAIKTTSAAMQVVKNSTSGLAYAVSTPAQSAPAIAASNAALTASSTTALTTSTVVMGIMSVLTTIMFAL